jgi:hypothetical protein
VPGASSLRINQEFNAWIKWWDANKTNFVAEPHPKELRPQRLHAGDEGANQKPPSSLSPGTNSR